MKSIYLRIRRFDAKSARNQRITYYTLYTILFLAAAFVCFFGFLADGKTLIWNVDGLKQHYTALEYFGHYLKEIVRNLFSTGRLEIPLWDPSIGFGSDVLSTLNYYAIGDPLDLLSVLVPASKMEYFYDFLCIFRLYLAGVCFSMYCRTMNRRRFATLCGALAYSLCFFGVSTAARHPFFINPMIYLPLLLIGIEKIFSKKKPFLFIAMVFVSAASNFYFFYMLSILIFIYAVVRFCCLYSGPKKLKKFFLCLCSFSGYYLIGVLLASFLFIPNVMALLASERFQSKGQVPLLYDKGYYMRLLYGSIAGENTGGWTILGGAVPIIPAVALLFMKRKKHRELKAGMIIVTLMLLTPLVGCAMNGFSKPQNRWAWGVCFLLAFILTTMLPDLLKMTKKQIIGVNGAMLAYFVVYLILKSRPEMVDDLYISWIILFLTMAALTCASLAGAGGRGALFKAVPYGAVLVLTLSSLAAYGIMRNPPGGGRLQSFADRGTVFEKVRTGMSGAAAKLDDPEFFRFERLDINGRNFMQNEAMLNGVNGVSFYFSQANGNVAKSLKENANRIYLGYSFMGLDNRVMLDTLSNVKYQVADGSDPSGLYFGHEPLENTDTAPYRIYKNKYQLPFGYTYSSFLTRKEFNKIKSSERQEAMMQAAVLEKSVDGLEKAQPVLTQKDNEFEIECKEGVTYRKGTFIVKKPSKVILTVKGTRVSENYLVFEKLKGNEARKSRITVKANGVGKLLTLPVLQKRHYEETRDHIVNLGYSAKPVKKIKIIFANKGVYKFKRMRVVSQPLGNYPGQVERLKEDSLENTAFQTNKITGNITLDKTKLLCLTLPYSSGWSAYVDGEKTEVLQTNTMYSGILLEPGSHTVEVRYFTPGLGLGLVCLFAGLALTAVIAAYHRKRPYAPKL